MNATPETAASAVRFFERALGKLPAATAQAATAKIELAPERVRALLAATVPLTPQQTRIALARHTRAARRGSWGRKGMPEHVWRAMYQEYCAGKSLAEVAVIFGGTRQSVYDIFKVRRLALRPIYPRVLERIVYRGRAYTSGKKGYYRATEGDRQPLHHAIWENEVGPIPEGWQVYFKDADCANVRPDNLACAPIADVTRYHQGRTAQGGKAA